MTRRISETVRYQAPQLGAKDAHGNAKVTYAAPVDVGVYAFDPGSSSEPRTPGHDRVVVEPTLYFPAGDDLVPPEVPPVVPGIPVFQARGRVTARGLLYEVEGETREWEHPSGRFKANVVTLRRVAG